MNTFRKFHFLSIAFILFTFLSLSRYSIQGLPLGEKATGKGDIRFTLAHAVSAEFLLPGMERMQPVHLLPLLKSFAEGYSYIEFQKALHESESIHAIFVYVTASNSVPLERICKFQI